MTTISQLPNNKATGSTGISYEILKYLGPNAILGITALFNKCLKTQQIPKQ